MSHDEKVEHFLANMQARDVSRHRATPPIFRLLWRLGLRTPPPYFIGFRRLALAYGVVQGLLFAAAMQLGNILLPGASVPILVVLTGSLAMGVLGGLLMAWDSKRATRKVDLGAWSDYPGSSGLVPPS